MDETVVVGAGAASARWSPDGSWLGVATFSGKVSWWAYAASARDALDRRPDSGEDVVEFPGLAAGDGPGGEWRALAQWRAPTALVAALPLAGGRGGAPSSPCGEWAAFGEHRLWVVRPEIGGPGAAPAGARAWPLFRRGADRAAAADAGRGLCVAVGELGSVAWARPDEEPAERGELSGELSCARAVRAAGPPAFVAVVADDVALVGGRRPAAPLLLVDRRAPRAWEAGVRLPPGAHAAACAPHPAALGAFALGTSAGLLQFYDARALAAPLAVCRPHAREVRGVAIAPRRPERFASCAADGSAAAGVLRNPSADPETRPLLAPRRAAVARGVDLSDAGLLAVLSEDRVSILQF
jgi:hypothetical protein